MISEQNQKPYSLEALREGDRTEFARVVDSYSPMIYRLGLKMLNNPQDAEDILQETFIKAYRNIGKFDGRSSVSTWLYRIATNEALMSLRRKRPEAISFENPLFTRLSTEKSSIFEQRLSFSLSFLSFDPDDLDKNCAIKEINFKDI